MWVELLGDRFPYLLVHLLMFICIFNELLRDKDKLQNIVFQKVFANERQILLRLSTKNSFY